MSRATGIEITPHDLFETHLVEFIDQDGDVINSQVIDTDVLKELYEEMKVDFE